MKKFWLSEKMLAMSFWEALDGSLMKDEAITDSKIIGKLTSPLVKEFPSIAGSISGESSYYLWLIAKYFSPENICEIGTYIGRSTLIMALASSESLNSLDTCDGSFDCWDSTLFKNISESQSKNKSVEKIRYYGKTMSTDMLGSIAQEGKKVDFMFIDGRISADDCKIMKQVLTDDAVIILDDFEGVEKGIVNAVMLRQAFPNYLLLDSPVSKSRKEKLNFALMIPSQIISISRQQSLPVEM